MNVSTIPDLLKEPNRRIEPLSPIPFGYRDDQFLWWDPHTCPHALIEGGTGSGKSVFLQSVLFGAALRSWEVTVIDVLKGCADFRFLNQMPGCDLVEHNFDVFYKIADVWKEMKDRWQFLIEQNVTVWTDLPAEYIPDPLILAIDEAHNVFVPGYEPTLAITRIRDIARRGRAVGVHVLLASQNFSSPLMAQFVTDHNFGLRVAFSQHRHPNYSVLETDCMMTPPFTWGNGHGAYRLNEQTPHEFQGYFAEQTSITEWLSAR